MNPFVEMVGLVWEFLQVCLSPTPGRDGAPERDGPPNGKPHGSICFLTVPRLVSLGIEPFVGLSPTPGRGGAPELAKRLALMVCAWECLAVEHQPLPDGRGSAQVAGLIRLRL